MAPGNGDSLDPSSPEDSDSKPSNAHIALVALGCAFGVILFMAAVAGRAGNEGAKERRRCIASDAGFE